MEKHIRYSLALLLATTFCQIETHSFSSIYPNLDELTEKQKTRAVKNPLLILPGEYIFFTKCANRHKSPKECELPAAILANSMYRLSELPDQRLTPSLQHIIKNIALENMQPLNYKDKSTQMPTFKANLYLKILIHHSCVFHPEIKDCIYKYNLYERFSSDFNREPMTLKKYNKILDEIGIENEKTKDGIVQVFLNMNETLEKLFTNLETHMNKFHTTNTNS